MSIMTFLSVCNLCIWNIYLIIIIHVYIYMHMYMFIVANLETSDEKHTIFWTSGVKL